MSPWDEQSKMPAFSPVASSAVCDGDAQPTSRAILIELLERFRARRADWFGAAGGGWSAWKSEGSEPRSGPLGRRARDVDARLRSLCPSGATISDERTSDGCNALFTVTRATTGACLVLEFRTRSSVPLGELVAWARRLEATRAAARSTRWRDAPIVDARSAAALHDLRHLFTVMRFAIAAAPASTAHGDLERALSDAEHLCDEGLVENEETRFARIGVVELARRQSDYATRVARRNPVASVAIDGAAGLEVVTAPATLGRLVRNLVVNAIECSRDGGAVFVRCTRDGACVRIEIRDEGPGTLVLPAPDRAMTLRADARGVGLQSIVAAAAEIGAELSVVGEIGRGSTVVIRLPAAEEVSTLILAPRGSARAACAAQFRDSGAHVFEVADCAAALRVVSGGGVRSIVVSPAACDRAAPRFWREVARRSVEVRVLRNDGTLTDAAFGAQSPALELEAELSHAAAR